MHGIQNSLDTALPATNAGKRFENDLNTSRRTAHIQGMEHF